MADIIEDPQRLFEQLTEDLAALNTLASPASYHGMVTGRLVASGLRGDAGWIEQSVAFLGLAEPVDSPRLRRVLALPEQVAPRLQDSNFGFDLPTPGEELPLAERARSLGEWCEGFVLGLAWGGLDSERCAALSPDLSDGLADLVSIAGVAVGGDGDESDLVELQAYVRLVVLNFCAEAGGPELAPAAPGPTDQGAEGAVRAARPRHETVQALFGGRNKHH